MTDPLTPWPQAPAFTLLADLDNDGTFETDLSDYLLKVDVDMKRESALDAFSPRSATLVLDNEDSRFSPRNMSSPYAPNLKRGRKVQLSGSLTMREVTNLSENPSAEYDAEGNFTAKFATVARDPAGFVDDFDIDSSSLYTETAAAGFVWNPAESRLEAASGVAASQLLRNGFAARDVKFDLEIDRTGSVTDIVLRRVDASNFYRLELYDESSGGPTRPNFTLTKMVAGVATQIGGFNVGPAVGKPGWASGVRHRVTYSAQGARHRVYWDGALVIDVDDGSLISAGQVGLGRLTGGGGYMYKVEVFDLSAASARALYGEASVKVTTANADNSGVLHTKRAGTRFAVTVGTAYAAQVSTVADAAAKAMTLGIRWFASGGSSLSVDEISFTPGIGDSWSEASLVATAPASAVTAWLEVLTDGAQGVFNFWCDGWAFYASPYVQPYCDGDAGGSEWVAVGGVEAPHMGSTSHRASNPSVIKFTGAIREIGLQRGDNPKEITLTCTGEVEKFVNTPISAGTFAAASSSSKMRPSWVFNRLLDILAGGELLVDGACRVYGDAWAAINGASSVAVQQSFDRAVEAAGFRVVQVPNGFDTGGARLDLTSRVVPGASERFGVFVGVHAFDGYTLPAGYSLLITLKDNTGVVATTTVTLPATVFDWVYAEIEGTFAAGSTVRSIEITATGAAWTDAANNAFKFTCFHLAPTQNHIARATRGNFWDSVNLAEMSGFERSGQLMMEELLKSTGAWVMEDGDGTFVAEDFSTRWANRRALVRLSDNLDGFGYASGGYNERAGGLYNLVRVGSYGAVSRLGNYVITLWTATENIVLSANERRVLKVPYTPEGEGAITGWLIAASYTLSAGGLATDSQMGSIATPYILNYGDVGEIVLVAGASGATLTNFKLTSGTAGSISAGIVRGSSEIVYLEYDAREDSEEEARTLNLEMPAQGYKSELMTLVAHWAGSKYSKGRAQMDVTVQGSTLAKMLETLFREPGDTVWLKHKTGQGAFYLDGLFFIEGMSFSFDAGGVVTATWHLEEDPSAANGNYGDVSDWVLGTSRLGVDTKLGA